MSAVLAAATVATIPSATRAQSTQPSAVPDQLKPSTTRESRFSRSADSEVKFQEGLLHYNRGQLAAAEKDFSSLIIEDPADAESYYYLGLSQLDQGKAADSLSNFDQAIRLDSTFIEVRAARATAAIRVQKYDVAQNDIAALEADSHFSGLSDYLRGQLLYAQGDLDAAAAAFARAKKIGGVEADPASFYEGLTYIRLRQLVRAREAFRNSSQSGDTSRDPTLAAASQQLDTVLSHQQGQTKPWEAQLTVAYEYDSNVIQIGSGIPIPQGISDQSDFRWVAQPRGSYSFIQNSKVEVGIEGNGYFAWEQDLSDFDVASYQAGPFINYKIAENLYGSARYGFNYIELGHDPFLKRNVVTPQLTYVEPKFGYSSGFFQFQTRQYDETPPLASLDRDGQTYTFGLVQGINLPPLFKGAAPANLELSYRLDDQRAKGSDYDGWFNTVGATLYAPLPFWGLRADAGVNLTYEMYDNGNSLDASGDRRRDFEVGVSTGITKQFNKAFSVRVDYNYTNRDSNVETALGQKPFEYDRHQVGVRLIFSF